MNMDTCKDCKKLTGGFCWKHIVEKKGDYTIEELLDFLPAGFEKNKVGNEKYHLTIIKTPAHLIGFMDNKQWQVSYSTSDGLEIFNNCFFEENELKLALKKMIDYLAILLKV